MELNFKYFVGFFKKGCEVYSDFIVSSDINCDSSLNVSRETFFPNDNSKSSEQQYLCKYCGKTFRWKPYLQLHIRSHTGERPFVCNICSKGFCKQSHLKEHIRIHTGEKPFKCKICDYCAVQSSHLKQHYIARHNEYFKQRKIKFFQLFLLCLFYCAI